MPTRKLNIILFCNRPVGKADASTISDHIDAFSTFSRHNWFVFSHIGNFPYELDIDRFDVVVIHYSSPLLDDYYISSEGKRRIANFKRLKVIFIQDEYRRINDLHDAINQLGIDVLFTCIPENEIEKVYPQKKLPKLTKFNNLTGYVPKNLLSMPSPMIKNRAIDVGYRARQTPFWLGQLGHEKSEIVDKFLEHTKNSGLSCDLSYSEGKRIYGPDWYQFIMSCKCMLGVESGASVLDFTGAIEKEVVKYQALNPSAKFETVQNKFFKQYENLVDMRQISPRCFESAALKTPMVLYEGNYSGILAADRHYISLKKDFSNINEVIAKIKDDDYLQKMADITYDEVALNEKYFYECFIKNFDEKIEHEFEKQKMVRCDSPYQLDEFNRDRKEIAVSTLLKLKMVVVLKFIFNRLPFSFREQIKYFLKPLLRFLKLS